MQVPRYTNKNMQNLAKYVYKFELTNEQREEFSIEYFVNKYKEKKDSYTLHYLLYGPFDSTDLDIVDELLVADVESEEKTAL